MVLSRTSLCCSSLVNQGYAFEYKPPTVTGKKLLPRSVFSFFVGMESANRLYRIFVPSAGLVKLCRIADFKILRQDTSLPSIHTLLEDLARKVDVERHFEE